MQSEVVKATTEVARLTKYAVSCPTCGAKDCYEILQLYPDFYLNRCLDCRNQFVMLRFRNHRGG